MSTANVAAIASPVEPECAADDHLVHLVCGFAIDIALCGKPVDGTDWLPMVDYPDDCLVCEDLSRQPCPHRVDGRIISCRAAAEEAGRC